MSFPDHQRESEAAVLACAYLSDEVAAGICEVVQDKHLVFPAHKSILKVIGEIRSRGEAVDLTSIKRTAEAMNLMEQCGGVQYVIQLADSVASVHNWRGYVRELHNKWRLREVAERAKNLQKIAESGKYAEAMLQANTLGAGLQGGGDSLMSVADALACYSPGRKKGVRTMIPFIDGSLGQAQGATRGEFQVIGGTSGSGKTNLLTQAAHHACSNGRRVIFATQELSTDDVIRRILQHICGFPSLDEARKQNFEGEYLAAMKEMETWDLHFWDPDRDDQPDYTIEGFAGRVRQLHEVAPIDLILMDYYQLFETVKSKGRTYDDLKEVSTVTRALMKRTNAAGLLAAQVDPLEGGKGWKVRDCKQAEKDAASVWVLAKSNENGDMKLGCQKNRHGASGFAKPVSRNPRTMVIEDPKDVMARMKNQ